jgi:tripartite-type tricarboxylate transporter receptor subunit TctC
LSRGTIAMRGYDFRRDTRSEVGFEGFSSTPEELEAFIKVQLGVWENMVKDADIKPN